jgi:signal transduction histidine kinase
LTDTKSVSRVLTNLLGNAIKLTEKGWTVACEGLVKCEASNAEESGSMADFLFEVEDTVEG